MATPSSNAGKQSKSADAKREAPAKPPEETMRAEAPAAEAFAVEATSSEAPAERKALEPVAVAVERAPAPPAIVASFNEEAYSASFAFDSAVWSKKPFELWAENASAFLDFAERIAKARTVEEVVELQTRFATERFYAFMRQSKELMEFAQGMASFSAPLCDARKAA
jgi:Phasin protein